MSHFKTRHVLTSESVSEGHPDKVCDQISDAVLDACLAEDPDSRVACETLATTNFIMLAGELTTKAVKSVADWDALARSVVADIGYTDPTGNFTAADAQVVVRLHRQSPDISKGVNASTNKLGQQGAGDQGMMYGYACRDTEAFMPAPIYYSHRIIERFAQLRHTRPDLYPFLRPDAKAQLSFVYEDGKPIRITDVVVSHQHIPGMKIGTLRELAHEVVREVVPEKFLRRNTRFYVNPTGKFVIGGPDGDAGLTGRKIIVDTYGGLGRHGGGAFSGKDPSKVDRSGAYMARHVAKNLVAAGVADCCEVCVAYAIGVTRPLAINVDTFGTGKVPDEKIARFLMEATVFDFRPAQLIEYLGLKRPKGWSYRQTATYGHFGRDLFPWEKLTKVKAIQQALL